METIYTTTSSTPEVLVTHNPKSREILNYEEVTLNYDGSPISTTFDGTGEIYKHINNKYYKAVFHDNVINLNNFIIRTYADNDPTKDENTDITDLLQFIIKIAFNLSPKKPTPEDGWRSPLKIKLPTGKFVIKDTILNSISAVSAGRFVFEGDGYQNTIVSFQPETEKFLFNNTDIIGFTTFSNIGFISNDNGKFMNTAVALAGNAQSLIFSDSTFDRFKTILDVSGNNMMSEITFRNCKIRGKENNQILFKLNNSQAVNWRFYATDIETICGVVFDFYQGMTISYYQGSIIGNTDSENVIFRVNSAADPNQFGPSNSPNLQMNGVRFELRHNTQLIKIENDDVEFSAKFDNCGMGGEILNSNIYPIDIKSRGNFIFDNCSNYDKFKFKHQVTNSNAHLHPAKIKFINSCPDLETINNGICNTVDNSGGYPIYIFDNCGLNSYYRPFGRDTFYLNDEYYKISKKIISKGYQNNGSETTGTVQDRSYINLGSVNPGVKELVYFNLPNVPIHSIKIVFDKAWSGGYGGESFNVKAYNADNIEIASGILNTDNKLELMDNRGYFVANNDKIRIEIENIGTLWSSSFGVKVFLVVEY